MVEFLGRLFFKGKNENNRKVFKISFHCHQGVCTPAFGFPPWPHPLDSLPFNKLQIWGTKESDSRNGWRGSTGPVWQDSGSGTHLVLCPCCPDPSGRDSGAGFSLHREGAWEIAPHFPTWVLNKWRKKTKEWLVEDEISTLVGGNN